MFAPRTSPAFLPIEKPLVSFSGGQRDRDHPSLLNPNEYAKGINVEIREAGLAQTRRGWQKKTDDLGSQLQGAIFFDPPDQSERLVVAMGGQFWEWQGSGTAWTRIGLTQLNNVNERVSFVALNGTLLAFCGADDNVKSWNGSDPDFTDRGNTNTDPPRGNIAWIQANRVCCAGVESTATLTNAQPYVFYSDILGPTVWNRSGNNTRIPTKYDEAVTAGATYRKQEILVWTRGSTHKIDISGATVSSFTRETLDDSVGCVAPDSVSVVGEDAFFVSADRNLRTIKRTINDIAYGVSTPITAENPNLMGRIKKTKVQNSVGIFNDNYYLLGAPMDASDTVNEVIPFDMLHQKQSTAGVIPVCLGEWTNINAGKWVQTYFSGIPQLYFLDSLTGAACLMFERDTDDNSEIPITINLRAEDFGSPDHDKTMHSVHIQVLDTFGNFDLSYARDGDASFSAFYTDLQISDPNSVNLPVNLPFDLPVGGILDEVYARFHRKGRSKYWQLQIHHTDGRINIKFITMRAFIEMMNTRAT